MLKRRKKIYNLVKLKMHLQNSLATQNTINHSKVQIKIYFLTISKINKKEHFYLDIFSLTNT